MKPATARPKPPRTRTPKTAPIVASTPTPAPVLSFIYRNELLDRVQVSYPTLWNWMRQGKFPLARELGPGRIAWLAHEVDEWFATRPVRQFKSKTEAA